MTIPVDGSHLSDVDKSLFIDQYGGKVQEQFIKQSHMREYAYVRPVLGTDTVVDNRMGTSTMQKLVPGVRPDAHQTKFGKVSLTVDTVVLMRDSRSMLNEFQTHFEARMRLAKQHGKQIGFFFDQAFLIQAIKGAGQSAPSGLDGAIGAGKSVTLSAANDEQDPNKLYAAIKEILVEMEEDEIPSEEMVVFVRPTEYGVLLEHDKLMSRDFTSDNGDYKTATIKTIYDARIVKSARIPNAVNDSHFLSNADNSNAYNVSAEEARTVAVILHPDSLMAGETIPLSSNIFFNETEKVWFIDSWLAFGVTVARPDICGRVLKAA